MEMLKNYSAYLFDADGTLIDTTELIYRCFANTFQVFANRSVERDEILPYIGLPLGAQLELYFGKLDEDQMEKLTRVHMEYQLSIADRYLRPFPTVAEGLSLLKLNGKRLAVVTSRRMNTLGLYLEKTGLLGFFDVIITHENTQNHKPHAEPALKAAQELGCAAGEALMIGDSTYDIECGSNAGMDTAFVRWSCNEVGMLRAAPTYIIDDFRQLAV